VTEFCEQGSSVDSDLVKEVVRGVIAVITLNRPEKANAYNAGMLAALEAACNRWEGDPGVKVVVLQANGRHFCAGADLSELKARGYEGGLNLSSARIFERIARSPKITIAAIQGAALGGGFELSLACDLRVASPDVRFGLPELSHRLLPAAGGIRRLGRLIGPARSKAVILAGRELGANEAQMLGLVLEVVGRERLRGVALELAQRVATLEALPLRLAKEAIDLEAEYHPAERLERVSQALLYELAHRPGKR